MWSQIRQLEEAVEKVMAPQRQLEAILQPWRELDGLTRRSPYPARKTSTFVAAGISNEQEVINDKVQTELARVNLELAHTKDKVEAINAEVSTHRIYAFIDWRDKYIKIGFSRKFKKPSSGRVATHTRSGLEYLGDRYGTQDDEDHLKDVLHVLNKQFGDGRFTPRTGTTEYFKISRELIDILVSLDWPLGEGDPYELLDDHRQGDLGL